MLPGFRILFGTVILSVSLLIFALGAAALLRSAHDNFANQPNWRDSVDVAGSFKPTPSNTPSLAMLRVEPDTQEITAPKSAEKPHELPAKSTDTERQAGRLVAPSPVEPLKGTEASASLPATIETHQIAAPAPSGDAGPQAPLPGIEKIEREPEKNAALIVPEEPKAVPMPPAAAQPSSAPEAPAPKKAETSSVEKLQTASPENAPSDAGKSGRFDQFAMLNESAVPLSDIKLPKPRIDPEITRAKRLQRILIERRAKARAAARRAAARARAAQFGQPSPNSNTSFQTTQQPFTQVR